MDVARLHRLARTLREVAAAAAAEAADDQPLSAGQLAVVEDLARHEATTVGEVARRTGLAQSLVSTTVAGLRGAGVVTARTDAGDRRRILVTLADDARSQMLSRSGRPVAGALRRAVRAASPELDDAALDAATAEVERALDAAADRLA